MGVSVFPENQKEDQVAGRTLTRDAARQSLFGAIITAVIAFFTNIIIAIKKEVVKVKIAETAAGLFLIIGLIIMMGEIDTESLTVFVIFKTIGLAIFAFSVFLLRKIDPDSWVNPWEKR